MDHGSTGPEKPDYPKDVEVVRRVLAAGQAVVLRFVANATAHELVLVPLGVAKAGRPADQLRGVVFTFARPPGLSDGGLFVGVAGRSTWLPTSQGPLHPMYIGRQLGHPFGWHDPNDVDDEPLARFLNDLIAPAPVPAEVPMDV